MKVMLLAALFLFSLNALAHVEPGTYRGVKADGSECSMVAGETYFEKNMAHPLNERISITVGEDAFTVGHPPVVDSKDSYVFFNHDLFQGVLPTSTGAKALEIEMVHSEQFEGPTAFTFVENNWKTKVRGGFRCKDIKHVQ